MPVLQVFQVLSVCAPNQRGPLDKFIRILFFGHAVNILSNFPTVSNHDFECSPAIHDFHESLDCHECATVGSPSMRNQNDEIEPCPEWPDRKHPNSAGVIGGIAWIGLVAMLICVLGYNLGHDYLPMLKAWVTRVLPWH
jgi:hypothetical protein